MQALSSGFQIPILDVVKGNVKWLSIASVHLMLTAGSSTIQQLVALKLKQNLRRPQLESQLKSLLKWQLARQ
jgi:hypothetical protein